MEFLFVFNGANSSFPSAIFTEKKDALQWITKNKLSGILNKYPVNVSLYDWAIEKGFFEIKNENQKKPAFIQSFTCANIEHWHAEDGEIIED